MAEALWVQASGVDYSAAEDRRLISSVWNPGVIYGLTLAGASGLSGTVAAGRCVVPDGAGGGYLCYFDAATTVSGLSASATTNTYCTVNTTTGIATIVKGATPTGPYLQLGSFVTSTTAVTSVNNTAAAAESPSGVRYVPLTGGTMSGRLTGTDFQVPTIFRANADGVNAPGGVKLGGTYSTARASVMASRTTAQTVPNATWSVLHFNANSTVYNDYAATTPLLHDTSSSTVQGRFLIPVPGVYHFSGNAYFADPAGAAAGTRRSRLAQYNSGNTLTFVKQCALTLPFANGNTSIWFEGLLDCAVGDVVQFEVYQDQGASLDILAGTATDGRLFYGRMRLVQAN